MYGACGVVVAGGVTTGFVCCGAGGNPEAQFEVEVSMHTALAHKPNLRLESSAAELASELSRAMVEEEEREESFLPKSSRSTT